MTLQPQLWELHPICSCNLIAIECTVIDLTWLVHQYRFLIYCVQLIKVNTQYLSTQVWNMRIQSLLTITCSLKNWFIIFYRIFNTFLSENEKTNSSNMPVLFNLLWLTEFLILKDFRNLLFLAMLDTEQAHSSWRVTISKRWMSVLWLSCLDVRV